MHDSRFAKSLPLVCGAGAVICGCGILLMAGAPIRMPLINLAALCIAFAVAGASTALPDRIIARLRDAGLLALAASLVATALFGASTAGVARWLVVGGLTIQPAMIAVPLVVIAFAMRPSLVGSAAVAICALGVALQPDPGAAAMLLLGIAATAVKRGARTNLALALACAAAFALAWMQAAPLPPAQYAEGVILEAWRTGGAAMIVASIGLAFLFTPSLVGAAPRAVRAAFLAVWAAAVMASLIGPYPTPVLGFGGSAILGYILSCAFVGRTALPRSAGDLVTQTEASAKEATGLRFA